MKKLLILFLLACTSTYGQRLDFALAGSKGIAPAVSLTKFYGKKFKVGLGVRATAYVGGQTDYITAPALLTSGKRSLVAFFTPYKNEKLDTLKLPSMAALYLNTTLSFEYEFKRNSVGFGIDLFGLTFGPKKTGVFKASDSKDLNNKSFVASPTRFNVLLISDSDRGSLNSELYYKRMLKRDNALRLGLSFQFVEYTTESKLTYFNDRFRSKSLIPFIAINLPIKK